MYCSDISNYISFIQYPPLMTKNVGRNESPSQTVHYGRLHVEKPVELPGSADIRFPRTTET